jgi:hypothetical protein
LRVAGELDGLPRAAEADPDHDRHAASDDPRDLLGEVPSLIGCEV